jgi:hypothetical protein
MSVRWTSMPDLNRRAFDILSRELGPGESVLFFSQMGLGAGNYANERRAMFAGLTMEEYRAAVQQLATEPGETSK